MDPKIELLNLVNEVIAEALRFNLQAAEGCFYAEDYTEKLDKANIQAQERRAKVKELLEKI